MVEYIQSPSRRALLYGLVIGLMLLCTTLLNYYLGYSHPLDLDLNKLLNFGLTLILVYSISKRIIKQQKWYFYLGITFLLIIISTIIGSIINELAPFIDLPPPIRQLWYPIDPEYYIYWAFTFAASMEGLLWLMTKDKK